jgi:hypothetical protein
MNEALKHIGAILLVAAFWAGAALLVWPDIERASQPVYTPDGVCIVNCK